MTCFPTLSCNDSLHQHFTGTIFHVININIPPLRTTHLHTDVNLSQKTQAICCKHWAWKILKLKSKSSWDNSGHLFHFWKFPLLGTLSKYKKWDSRLSEYKFAETTKIAQRAWQIWLLATKYTKPSSLVNLCYVHFSNNPVGATTSHMVRDVSLVKSDIFNAAGKDWFLRSNKCSFQ